MPKSDKVIVDTSGDALDCLVDVGIHRLTFHERLHHCQQQILQLPFVFFFLPDLVVPMVSVELVSVDSL